MTQGQQVRDSVVYMVPALVGNVLPLVTLPLITRALSPAEYGMWALALAYGSFVIGLANFGLSVIMRAQPPRCRRSSAGRATDS